MTWPNLKQEMTTETLLRGGDIKHLDWILGRCTVIFLALNQPSTLTCSSIRIYAVFSHTNYVKVWGRLWLGQALFLCRQVEAKIILVRSRLNFIFDQTQSGKLHDFKQQLDFLLGTPLNWQWNAVLCSSSKTEFISSPMVFVNYLLPLKRMTH